MLTVTVSQLNRYIKAVLEEDRKLTDLYIKGEISNFNHHYRSGHFYFSLKDQDSSIRAVMFRSDNEHLRFQPEDGMAVLVRARVGVFERDGAYQLYVTDIQPDGVGALAVAFEQCKARLAAKGLFDEAHKKPLPEFPRRIGVVTAETGAALQDIRSVLERRYPVCTLVLAPALVQGHGAAATIAEALQQLDRQGSCDLLIVARGGGSAEDLWCFNDEALAQAVYDCDTPVISAVGHETDFTICDFVADLRAPTPSAAAELATPSVQDITVHLSGMRRQLAVQAHRKIFDSRSALQQVRSRPVLQDAAAGVKNARQRLDFFAESLYNKKRVLLRDKRGQLETMATLLDSLSPMRVLSRGYTAVFREKDMIASVGQLEPGDVINIRFRDGAATAAVTSLEEGSPVEEESDL